MDPMSITVGVISLVAVALHSTRRIIEFIDGIQGAPQAVKALSRDLNALEQVLQTLNDVVSHPGFQSNTRRASLATLLQDPLDNCALALEDISLAIRPYTKPSRDPRKSKWRGFTWSFREKEIVTLQRMLMSYKSSLNMAVAVANLSTTSAGFSDTQKQIRGLQQHLNADSRSVANSSYQGSEPIGSDPGFTLRRYLLQSDQNSAVFNEIGGQQIYEMGSNFSESLDGVDDGFREPPARPQTDPGPSSSGTESKSHEESDRNIQELEPPVVLTNQALDVALSTLRPDLSETFELKALGPTFGIDLEMLYRRDGVFVPRVIQYCVAIAEQVSRQTLKLYDLGADTDDITYLKDRFDNGRPVQVNARAVFDHCTVDPRKLSFSKGDEILVLEPRDEKWFVGRRQDASGLLPIDFVQFSVQDIAKIIGTCKAFFMDLPNSLIPKLQYDKLIKAAGTESAGDRRDQMNTTIHELPLPHLELLKFMILHLHRISIPHSETGTVAMDLARPWAPILMRRNDESAVAEEDQELQVRVVHTLIASAEEVFEADPTEKYADPSFSSVTLMPNARPSVTSESDHARTQSLSASARPFRSFWPAETTYVIRVISKCTEIIESNDWKSQIYCTDASQSEVIRARFSLTTGPASKLVELRHAAPTPLAVATLLKALIAAKPNPLMALEDTHWDTVTEVVSPSSPLSTKDGFRGRARIRRTEHYEILEAIMLHLCRISEKYKNAFSLAQIWTPVLTQEEGSPSEQRDLYELVQGMIMNAYEFFEEPRPQSEQPMIYELE